MSTTSVKASKVPSRSVSAIAGAAADREARRAAVLARRLARFAQRWKEISRQTRAHEKLRRTGCRFQEAGVEWLMGYDTPAAKLFAEFVSRAEAANREAQRRKKVGADPLNITGHSPTVSPKQQRKQDEKDRLARGEKKLLLTDPEHPNQNVLVTALPHSLRRVKLKLHQESAAEKFLSDCEAANYTGLSSMPFDPRVDSSPSYGTGPHRAAEAALRLKMAKSALGQRNYDIVEGVLFFNANPTKIHAAGGRQHTIVSDSIDVAFNELATFYDPVRIQRDPTWKAFEKLRDEALALIKRGKDEVG